MKNQYWFLDKSHWMGYGYTLLTTLSCALVDMGLVALFVWWLNGTGCWGSAGILLLFFILTLIRSVIVGYFWALHIIAPAAWMVRKRGLYRKTNSAIIVLLYTIAAIVICCAMQVGLKDFAELCVVWSLVSNSIHMAKIQFERSCCMCVEEFNLNPELYNDIEIEQKAFDIYWQEKVKQTFNTIKFYGYISTNNKEA